MRQTIILVILPLLAARCAPPPEDDTSTAAITSDRTPLYRDVEEGLASEADQERWFTLTRALVHDFDQICGDTFCEGDFSNLASLSFRCSASISTGDLKSCLWLFAGSYETVTPATGHIRPVARIFQCQVPVQGSVTAFLDALLPAGQEAAPLQRPLPGQAASIYESLIDCL
jgi:hypothetical protein